jgi:TrmH family RNA methyltransferase
VCLLPEHVMAAVCDTKTPQGAAAVVRMREQPLTGRRLAVLDGVQDPGNVGTILRTADAAGLDGALLSRACADPYSPKVLRATMGSIFHLPLVVTDNLPGELAARRDAGMDILSSQLDGSPFRAYAPNPQGYVLVIGSEGNGVTDAVRALATHSLRLPMRGRAESLNAAVAAGIMMYQLTEELG